MVSKCFLIECGQKIKFPKVEGGVKELGDRFVVFASWLHKCGKYKKLDASNDSCNFHIIDMMLLSKYP